LSIFITPTFAHPRSVRGSESVGPQGREIDGRDPSRDKLGNQIASQSGQCQAEMAVGALFAFVTSFDEVVIALFIAGSEERTLPRQMWSGVRETLSPTIAAVATLLILFSTLFLATIQWLQRRAERQKIAHRD